MKEVLIVCDDFGIAQFSDFEVEGIKSSLVFVLIIVVLVALGIFFGILPVAALILFIFGVFCLFVGIEVFSDVKFRKWRIIFISVGVLLWIGAGFSIWGCVKVANIPYTLVEKQRVTEISAFLGEGYIDGERVYYYEIGTSKDYIKADGVQVIQTNDCKSSIVIKWIEAKRDNLSFWFSGKPKLTKPYEGTKIQIFVPEGSIK